MFFGQLFTGKMFIDQVLAGTVFQLLRFWKGKCFSVRFLLAKCFDQILAEKVFGPIFAGKVFID